VLEAHFFPNPENEPKIVNLVRKAKISLYIAIFALTNDRIYGAIEEVFKRGVPVKIIADDEMAKCLGSDIYKAASLVRYYLKQGNPCKNRQFCQVPHAS
jgi:phosphatidylserine/phosphatidylglycerophosphate/cardiolipin synthase-like enzyme